MHASEAFRSKKKFLSFWEGSGRIENGSRIAMLDGNCSSR